MAGAMLLYDEINRKGFEGDLVLNGFAEFIRNILVCKDERSAQLLDVVEGMQSKYLPVSKTANASYLISALNILNEAEINFKAARNKKLHVELTLIKLNFLQQAIDLALNDNGTVIKKKRIDTPVAVHFKPIPSFQLKNSITSQEAKLYVQETTSKQMQQSIVNNETVIEATSASVVAEQPTSIAKSTTQPIKKEVASSNGPKKNLLELLREKAGDQYTVEAIKEAELLDIEKLQQCWNDYLSILQNKNDKLSTASTFKIAKLNILDDIHFTITVNALTQQKFIEQEKLLLADHIQTAFNNRNISFSILVEDTEEKMDVPLHLTLNSRQRFERIADQYPLVKELKDRLKLEIDY
jgi:DNA polymerase-3 subunit gamma/tau